MRERARASREATGVERRGVLLFDDRRAYASTPTRVGRVDAYALWKCRDGRRGKWWIVLFPSFARKSTPWRSRVRTQWAGAGGLRARRGH